MLKSFWGLFRMKKQENLYCATCLKTGKQFLFYNFQTIEELKTSMPDYSFEKYQEEEG